MRQGVLRHHRSSQQPPHACVRTRIDSSRPLCLKKSYASVTIRKLRYLSSTGSEKAMESVSSLWQLFSGVLSCLSMEDVYTLLSACSDNPLQLKPPPTRHTKAAAATPSVQPPPPHQHHSKANNYLSFRFQSSRDKVVLQCQPLVGRTIEDGG